MPAVDPAVLRARVAALADQVYAPAALAAGVRALLDDYADRSYRASPRLVGSTTSNAYRTPAPVVRAVVNGLRRFALASPHAALDLAQAVWAGRSREERRIAAELVGLAAQQAPDKAMALVESWLPSLDSAAAADALAEFGLGPLILAGPAEFLAHARRWAQSPHRWTRRFGLACLLPLIKDKRWDNVPGALEVVRVVMRDTEAEVRAAAAAVLHLLIPKSPVEAGRFLREQYDRGNHHTHFIIRGAMARLAPEVQAELDRVMRS